MDLTVLDDDVLRRLFGVPTMIRARSYADNGQTQLQEQIELDGGGVFLEGESDGSHGERYLSRVSLTDGPRGVVQRSTCTCPVATGCKHVTALVIVARVREQQRLLDDPYGVPMWERRLEALLAELEETTPATDRHALDREPLALEVSRGPISTARQAYRWASDPSRPLRGPLRIRPLRRSHRGRWVKQGAAWSDLRQLRASGANYTHCDLLDQLQALYRAGLNSYYMTAETHLRLAAYGPGLWPTLERADEAGLDVVAGDGVDEVRLLDPTAFEMDFVSAGEEDRLRIGIRVADEWISSSDVEVLGDPGHGVAVWTPEGVFLAPLQRRVGPQLARLLADDSPLTVPARDRDVLMADYLPRLHEHVQVGSTGTPATDPGGSRPTLVLTLDWESADQVGLRWTWRYRAEGESSSDSDAVYDLDDERGRNNGVRRRRLEATILHALDPGPETAHRLYRDHDRSAGLVPRQTIHGYQAVGFAEDVLPELQKRADTGVLSIEEVGERPTYRESDASPVVRFSDAPAVAGHDAVDRQDWLGLDVVVTVEGHSIALAAVLEALTSGQTKVVLHKGLVVDLDVPPLRRLAELIDAARDLVEQPREGIAVRRPDLGLWDELAELGIVEGQASAFVAAARALKLPETLPAIELLDVEASLRPYQDTGVRWLAYLHQHRLGGLLADDMGLGKTLQTLALVAHARRTRPEDGPFLVVAPTSVLGTWASEAARFVPHLDVRVVTGTQARRGATLDEVVDSRGGADVVVTSYTLLRLEADAYAARAWGGLVLDEAQAVKNHQGKTHQAVRRLDAAVRVALTGTPVENRLMELWSLLSIVAPGLYPWPDRFRREIADPIEKARDVDCLRQLQRRIAPFLLRRTKDLVAADLPRKQEQVLSLALGRAHQKLYDTHLQRERQHVLGLLAEDADAHRIAILRSLTRLRLLSLDPALLDLDGVPDSEYAHIGSAKTDVLVDHLRDVVAEGHRALVFSQFTSYLRRVRDRCESAGIDTHYLDGTTRDRQATVQSFKDGGPSAFLISLKAGGTGLTLTEADYVFVLDPWWNPAVEAQAIDRAHRIGQTKPVMVYRLVSAGTIEEKVVHLQARKAALAASVLDPEGLDRWRNGSPAADQAAGSLAAEDVHALLS